MYNTLELEDQNKGRTELSTPFLTRITNMRKDRDTFSEHWLAQTLQMNKSQGSKNIKMHT